MHLLEKNTYFECPAKLRFVEGLSFDTLSIALFISRKNHSNMQIYH